MTKFEIIDIIGQCGMCLNKDENKPICDAFPKGVPNEILVGKFSHTKRYPGQENNILFELKDQ